MKLSTGILYLAIAWGCFWLPGYLHGKSVADRWYAQHWHPDLRLNDVLDLKTTGEALSVGDEMLYSTNFRELATLYCREKVKGTHAVVLYHDGLADDIRMMITCDGHKWSERMLKPGEN